MSCSRGNLKDKNDEKNADSGGLAHDVAEESKGSIEMRNRGYFSNLSVCTDHLGLRNPLWLIRDYHNSGENLHDSLGAIAKYFSQGHFIEFVVQGSQSYISMCKTCPCGTSYEGMEDIRLRCQGEWLMTSIERQGQWSRGETMKGYWWSCSRGLSILEMPGQCDICLRQQQIWHGREGSQAKATR